VTTNNPPTTGKEYYDTNYKKDVEWQDEWLQRGVRGKADSVEQLLRRNRITPQHMLELGAGTGAVIKECQRRGLAREYTAIDYSTEAINYLRDHSHDIRTLVADIAADDFALGGSFDLVVMSHVLEHLERPEDALRALGKMDFSYLIAEVPLENLLFYRWKWKLLPMLQDRSRELAGHVQVFTSSTFDALIRSCALTIVDRRRYPAIADWDSLLFLARRDASGPEGPTLKRALLRHTPRMLTSNLLPKLAGPAWTRLYYAHYAVLCS
jgi:SAM-dependent methyltransferase